ncbi:MAG: hypothetical protein WDW38_006379 [Sanguina aurantia]
MSALTSSMPNISKVLAEWPGAVVILGGFAFQHHYPKEVAAHPWLGTDDIDVKLWITTPACNLASARQIFFRLTELLGTGTTDRKVYLNQPPEEMAFLGNSPLVDVVLYHRNRLGPTLSLFCFPKPAHGQPCGVTPTQNGPYRYVASLELTNFNTLHMLCVLYHAFLSNNSRSNRIPNAAKVLCRALASFAVNGNAKLLLSMFEDIGRLPLSDSLTKFKHRDSQLDAGAVLGSMVDKWALAASTGYADWLIDESYEQVGDLAETIALMLPEGDGSLADEPLQVWMEQRLPALSKLESSERIEQLRAWWRALLPAQVFLLNKLITGSLRVGVSHKLVVQAIAQWSGQPSDLIAHRMSGNWKPAADALTALTQAAGEDEHLADRPYPFFLASPLEHEVETLGLVSEWMAEWKWDGIRAQLMRRDGQAGLWSRGEERLDGRFPEIELAAAALGEDGVLDGEILAWDGESSLPLPFTALQKRIGKLKPGAKLLASAPVCFMAYDLLEFAGKDLRETPLHERRALLATLIQGVDPVLMLSPPIVADSWPALAVERQSSRERQTEGLMLKRLDSPYRVGSSRLSSGLHGVPGAKATVA